MEKLLKFGQRVLLLSSLQSPQSPLPNEGYVVLLPAYSEHEIFAALSIARSYMTSLCKEYCCVGAMAADLEEQIDAALEDVGLFLPTTSFLSVEDACHYFLFTADAGLARYLFAPIVGHEDLAGTISMMANKN
jgi:hypothetical protein